ncbi:hypothetical protein KJ761_00205 [Patescibacteria group bacterium]|nr:hypothetical protein [Patescibacteria group bacterium]
MVQKIVFPTGGIFIGIKREGDANTNEILYNALIRRGFSTEAEGKQYKGKTVSVWLVDADFVNMLYADEKDFKLKFIVYMELEYIFQEFRIVEPVIRKKARHARYRKKYFKK